MKRTLIFSIILFLLVLPGCLGYRAVEYRIQFDDKNNINQIAMIFHGLCTSDSLQEKQKSDFDDLLDMIQGDKFLLESADDGIYVKERRLYEVDGELTGIIKGIFQEFKGDDDDFPRLKNNERILVLKDEYENVETNGRKIESADSLMIVWPKDQTEIFWKISNKFEKPSYSLLDYFRVWEKKN